MHHCVCLYNVTGNRFPEEEKRKELSEERLTEMTQRAFDTRQILRYTSLNEIEARTIERIHRMAEKIFSKSEYEELYRTHGLMALGEKHDCNEIVMLNNKIQSSFHEYLLNKSQNMYDTSKESVSDNDTETSYKSSESYSITTINNNSDTDNCESKSESESESELNSSEEEEEIKQGEQKDLENNKDQEEEKEEEMDIKPEIRRTRSNSLLNTLANDESKLKLALQHKAQIKHKITQKRNDQTTTSKAVTTKPKSKRGKPKTIKNPLKMIKDNNNHHLSLSTISSNLKRPISLIDNHFTKREIRFQAYYEGIQGQFRVGIKEALCNGETALRAYLKHLQDHRFRRLPTLLEKAPECWEFLQKASHYES